MKKRMTSQQEFEIMKMVLDKFLWIGFVVMAYGVYKMLTVGMEGLYYVFIGAVVLVLFLVVIIKEYEIIKK